MIMHIVNGLPAQTNTNEPENGPKKVTQKASQVSDKLMHPQGYNVMDFPSESTSQLLISKKSIGFIFKYV